VTGPVDQCRRVAWPGIVASAAFFHAAKSRFVGGSTTH